MKHGNLLEHKREGTTKWKKEKKDRGGKGRENYSPLQVSPCNVNLISPETISPTRKRKGKGKNDYTKGRKETATPS